jgi:hypothetical protein
MIRSQVVLTIVLLSTSAIGFARAQKPRQPDRSQVLTRYANFPLSFESNQGQTDSEIKFLSRGTGYALFLTKQGATLSLRSNHNGSAPRTHTPGKRPHFVTSQLGMRWAGANASPPLSGLDELPGRSNYFVGRDPQTWRTGVRNYRRLIYRDVYPYVDFVFYGNHHCLEYDIVVRPGADLDMVRLAYEDAASMRLDRNGDLVLQTAAGEVRQHKPVIYQNVHGVKKHVEGRYVLEANNETVSNLGNMIRVKPWFWTQLSCTRPIWAELSTMSRTALQWTEKATLISRDTRCPRIIPRQDCKRLLPVELRSPSTYLGGTDLDVGTGIAVNARNQVVVTGFTQSIDFPTK